MYGTALVALRMGERRTLVPTALSWAATPRQAVLLIIHNGWAARRGTIARPPR
jgi:hypothetical protein